MIRYKTLSSSWPSLIGLIFLLYIDLVQYLQGSTSDDQTDSKTVEFNRRRIFANVVDKICFALFLCIYIFLIFRFLV